MVLDLKVVSGRSVQPFVLQNMVMPTSIISVNVPKNLSLTNKLDVRRVA